jgi:hypothetical protein
MVLAAPEIRLGEVGASAFQVLTAFCTGTTICAALAEVGSMQTVTARVPPLPV